MYIIKQVFKKNIMVHNNIIENSLNLDSYVENYIQTELLNKNINGYITIKMNKYKYIYPKLITNKLYIHNKYIVSAFIEFDTLKFYKNQIIKNISLSEENKFEDLIFLYKNFNDKIKITAIDLNSSTEYAKNNNTIRIIDINYINNNINLIVENASDYFGNIQYYKNNIDKDKNEMLPFLNIPESFKFTITINKKNDYFNIHEVYDKLIKLPKNNNYIITFNKNSIEINETDNDIIYNHIDIYLINTLIEFNNYYHFSNN
jgi:hypothetical protein